MISEFHASTIIEVSVSFGFTEFSCDPSVITATLGVEPDIITIAGAPRVLKSGHEVKTPHSTWCIRSGIISKDVNDHLRDLLLQIQSMNNSFSKDWGEPFFNVLWKSNYLYAGNGPYYEPDVLSEIGKLNCAIYQDIYQVDSESEE